MSETTPEPRITQITFLAESIRAVAIGIQETAVATFAILIAVTHFSMDWSAKATITASLAIGLLGGLFVIPLIARVGIQVSKAAAVIQLVSLGGFLIAALNPNSGFLYIVGISLGMGILSMAIPLQTHYLKENFPAATRGRLFSISIVIRALSAMLFSWWLGSYLDADINRFPNLLYLFAAASAVAAICQFSIPSTPFSKSLKQPVINQSIGWLRNDRVFGQMIAAAMAMGIGVLSANALRVDYLANPDHNLQFDAKTIAMITGVIPSITRLCSTFFWGWLFDRMNFFRLRAIVNLVFLLGILLYFLPRNMMMIAIGSALFGLARGGGEILWNLWVTKLYRPEKIAGYMSVHTFMTGLRVAFAPFVGFYLVKQLGLSSMVAFSLFFVLLSFGLLWPLLKKTN